MDTSTSPSVDGKVPSFSTLYNECPSNFLDVDGCKLKGYKTSITVLKSTISQRCFSVTGDGIAMFNDVVTTNLLIIRRFSILDFLSK
jgi:hypothetical protein